MIVDRALTDAHAHALLRELTTVAPKRLSGSAGAAAAVAWGQRTLQAVGCDRVWLDEVMVPRWVRGDVEELVLLAGGEPTPLAVTALGGSIATPADGITADVVMVRSFEQLRELGDAARGKIVFFNRAMPRVLASTFMAYGQAVPQRTSGAIEAARVGAVAAIVRSMTTALDDHPHTGALMYDDAVPKVPSAAVSTLGAERIAASIAAGERVRLRLRLSCRSEGDVASANVVGEIRGSERPEEIVLLGGHLDAWDTGAGAHDDGAGCVHCIEALRLIRACGLRPRRTVRVVLFMNEENGLRGAEAYAAAHGAERHVAAIESDNGGFEPKGFATSEPEPRRSVVRALVAPLAGYGMGAVVGGGGGADIAPLARFGVPLYGLVVTSHRYFDYHHSARDTIDAVNEREVSLGAAAIAHLASCLADE